MSAIILPIKSEYVRAIIEGKKKYEYRKRICTKDIEKIYVYETAPVKKIVCAIRVEAKMEMEKKMLWDKTRNYSGLSLEKYNAYFAKQKMAYAYVLGNIEVFDPPKGLESFGVKYPPQSFIYVDI